MNQFPFSPLSHYKVSSSGSNAKREYQFEKLKSNPTFAEFSGFTFPDMEVSKKISPISREFDSRTRIDLFHSSMLIS